MAYNVNGARLSYRQALAFIAKAMIEARRIEAEKAAEVAANLLHDVQPGSRREYARLVISCYYSL